MKVALAIADHQFERAVLSQLASLGTEVIRRCLVASDVNTLPADIELIADEVFERRHQGQLARKYRVLRSVDELVAAPAAAVRERTDRLVPFVGVSGGVGTTTTALYSTAQTKTRTLLVDADLWHPALHLFVGSLESSRSGSLIEALADGPLESVAARWAENIWVIGGLDSPSRRHQITDESWDAFLDVALERFDCVRLDLGNHLHDHHPVIVRALSRAARTVVVTDAHPVSAIHTATAHDAISGYGSTAIHIVNQMQPGPIGVTAYRILSSALAQGITATIPRDDDAYSQAFIEGQFLSPRSPAYRALSVLTDLLEPAPRVVIGQSEQRTGSRRPGRVIAFGR